MVVATAAGVLVLVQAMRVATQLPPGSAAALTEARLVDAAYAALHPVGPSPATVGLVARLQLSGYALLTGAFERGPTVLAGARELGLVACAALLAAVAALTRSLAVRPAAAVVTLGVLALAGPALGALVTLGPGQLGAVWVTIGAALLARTRPGVRALGVPAVALGVATEPLLAVPVLACAVAVAVATPAALGIVAPLAVLPLALLPGGQAWPAVVVVTVLVALVVADVALDRLVPLDRPRPLRRTAVTAVVAAAGVAALVGSPVRVTRAAEGVPGAPGLAAWAQAATVAPLAVPPGVWADLLRAGLAPSRLAATGPLVVTTGSGGSLARFGSGGLALSVSGPLVRAVTCPEVVAGPVDPRVCTVRGTVLDVPAVPGEDPAVPRHRVVLARPAPELAGQVVPGPDPTVLTWPLPAPTG